MTHRPSIVLLHSPLVGPCTWHGVRARLHTEGAHTVVPDLRPPVHPEATPSRVAETAAAAIESGTACGPVVLVGHSMAGMLLPGIVQTTRRPAAALLVDSAIPRPGSTWLRTAPAGLEAQLRDLAEQGWLPPWHRWFPPETLPSLLPASDIRERFVKQLPRLPLSFFDEPFPGQSTWSCSVPVGYLLLSHTYRADASHAEELRWSVRRLDLHHLAPLTHPGTVADAILSVLDTLLPGRRAR
ncbi:pimeloyl-ACP methyl ester carboxylesterase [Saccharomonospora amisosensis]|uniref:Pimeloyl-ACP methyl ester carboxylesterase n=1 Tax=Saccharomonospora amisosensis TaxID=1128677 RepID=A0A7X5ZRL2_9PSEU|nr:alpha/beta hydrolase [Saccharomonospora amisosensis]NIJ12475.1 pimeloyl-ACP methyl ester carboxylesterase [Saccharomonospora amisosensis]